MDEVGLYYYGARWYDPYLNHWLQPDSIIPDPYNPLDYDRYSYVNNNPINFIDPTGHCKQAVYGVCIIDEDGEINDALETTQWPDNNSLDSHSPNALNKNGWDSVPIVSDVRSIIRGAQNASWTSNQPSFNSEQNALQNWYDNCYGQCHYSDHINPKGQPAGGPMPSTPTVDTYSEGMGEAANGIINLGMFAAEWKLTNANVFIKGGTKWHVGLEVFDNRNLIHLGNEPRFGGVHLALGSVGPFKANWHFYFQFQQPIIRFWKPKSVGILKR